MRPRLALRFRVRQQMHTTVRMRPGFIAARRWRAEKFAKPTQVIGPRKALPHALRPFSAEALYFVPTLFPAELRENRFRLLKKFRKRCCRWKKLNFHKLARDLRLVFRARAEFAKDFNIIDEDAAVCVAQLFFDFEKRHSLENLCVHSAKKLEKKFQPRILRQFKPRAPGVTIENARPQMPNPIVMGDRAGTKNFGNEPRHRTFLRNQIPNA